jgi:hypothetical protein
MLEPVPNPVDCRDGGCDQPVIITEVQPQSFDSHQYLPAVHPSVDLVRDHELAPHAVHIHPDTTSALINSVRTESRGRRVPGPPPQGATDSRTTDVVRNSPP